MDGTFRSREVPAAAAVFAVVVLFRLSVVSMTNDDFLHLALAQQVLLGDVPVRDFIDAGEILFYSLSAAVQHLFGRHLLSEVLLDVLLLATGYAVVFLLAVRASRSYGIAVAVTSIAVLLMPRLYSYPKILMYAVGLWLIWRYIDRPGTGALLRLAAWTAIAFLFRHDHGVALGLASGLAIVLAHRERGWRAPVQAALGFGGAAAVLVAPFLVFLHLNGGIASYWRNTIVTGRAEYERTVGPYPRFRPTLAPPRISVRWAPDLEEPARRAIEERLRLAAGEVRDGRTWQYDLMDASRDNIEALVLNPSVDDTDGVDRSTFRVTAHVNEPNVLAWFYCLTILVPPLACVALLSRPRGGSPPAQSEPEKLIAAVALAVLAYPFLLRAASPSAVADVAAVPAVLGAWLLRRGLASSGGWTGWALARAALTATVLIVTVAAVWKSEGSYQFGGFFWTTTGDRGFQPLAAQLDALRRSTAPFDDPAAAYVFDCTAESDRVLVTGYAPDLYYKSGRGFAAGRPYFLSTLGDAEHERFSVERLRRQHVPIVLAAGDPANDLAGFPAIQEHVQRHYRRAGQIPYGDTTYAVFADVRTPQRCTYGDQRLPCFGGCAGG